MHIHHKWSYGQWSMTEYSFLVVPEKKLFQWRDCCQVHVEPLSQYLHIATVWRIFTFFFKVGSCPAATCEGHADNWRGLLFWSLVLTGVTEDVWRAHDADEVAPVAFVTVNGASEALHHKISVANIWPWHVTIQQTTESKIVAVFCRSLVKDCSASHCLF